MFGLNLGASKPSNEPQGEFVIARLNAKVQPIDRGEYFEDPLEELIGQKNIGQVTGGGTQLCDAPCGIEFCDLEICVHDTNDETLNAIIQHLNMLGAPKGSKLIIENTGSEVPFGVHEGLALFVNGVDLPDQVYADCDINFVIKECDRLFGGKGVVKGNWTGDRETALFAYGESFEEMKTAIEEFRASYPLLEKSRVEQIA